VAPAEPAEASGGEGAEAESDEKPAGAGLGVLFRLKPYDTSTREGRAMERYRRATLITATSFLARALTATTSVISLPLTMGYLGKERYGMWAAISALLTWAVLADFGVARGLQNHLAEAYGKNDADAASDYMSTAFYTLLFIALGLGAVFGVALFAVPWHRVLNVDDPKLVAELRPTLAAVVFIFLAGFPLNVVGQAYAAYQRAHVANLFSIGASLVSLGLLVAAIKLKLGLPYLILATGGFGVSMTVVNLAYIAHDMPWLWPRYRRATKKTLAELMKISGPMLLIQLGGMLVSEVQILIIAQTLGVALVADYTIFQRVFSVPVLIVAMIEAPYPAMYRESHARGDIEWCKAAFRRLQRIKLGLSALGLVVLVAVGDLVAKLLSTGTVTFGIAVWVAAGVMLIVGNWNGGYSHLFMAVDRLWTLVITLALNAIVTFPLTYFFAKSHGIFGVIAATTAFSLVVTAWLMPVLARDLFRAAPPAAPAPAAG
jgi:O-antigen/teichoic acid export membrane protein